MTRSSTERLDMRRKGGKQDMDELSCGLESWLCVLIPSGCRLPGDCGVKGGRAADGHNDTLRQLRSARHAVHTLWCSPASDLADLWRSAASGLADLEVDDRSDGSEWIRQRSIEFSAARIATLRFFIFNTAHNALLGSASPIDIIRTHSRVYCDHSTHVVCTSPFPSSPTRASSLLVCSIGTAFSFSYMAVDSLSPFKSGTTQTFQNVFSHPECDEKEQLNFNLTRPNIVPILFLRSINRIVRRTRGALKFRSVCPHWTSFGVTRWTATFCQLLVFVVLDFVRISLFLSLLLPPPFNLRISHSLVVPTSRSSAAAHFAGFLVQTASC
ncbi:hypothetical protein BLNAU_21407 [Blattamonas nauphoetae]|uniref:Uncharacterized protein n=1 Tax=Blattamonas nauphoetae TaxID=2049346 RepID=A0ABQ9WX06_9EUKA|nr:hypothetical protein BLNAU_21407 [Blattamonas nauphoetae]